MLIAFDARPLSGKITGIGRYTLELVNAMASSRPESSWVALSHEPVNSNLKFPDNVDYICSNWNFPGDGVLWSQTALPYLIRRLKPDVFWSPRHHLPLLGTPATVKTVLTIHDTVFVRHPETMRKTNLLAEKLLFSASLQKAQAITSVSAFTKSELDQIFGPVSQPIRVVPGAAFSEFENLDWIATPEKFILAVGTLEPRKNLERLIAAYQQLPDEYRNSYQLMIVGVSGWKDRLDRSISFNNIIFTGYVSDAQLNYLYKRASLFAFISLYEGFGLPLLEAFRSGTPVITSDESSLPEVAGDAALLVDPMAVNEITLAITKVLSNPSLAKQMSEKGYARAADFDWRKSAEIMWSVFDM